MINFKVTSFFWVLLLVACNQSDNKSGSVTEERSPSSTDKEQIQNLTRRVLNWADKTSIDLLPVIADGNESVYIGIDLDKHKTNLDQLRQTNFFAAGFIENYNQIILALDSKLKSNESEKWFVGELPAFRFATDANPWCMCQDIPYDDPNPYDLIEINIVSLDSIKGEITWKWGKLESNQDPEWKDFAYKYRVVKENNKWKIAYLEGFDFEEATRTDEL